MAAILTIRHRFIPNDLAGLHDEDDAPNRCDVVQRIAFDSHQISLITRRDDADQLSSFF